MHRVFIRREEIENGRVTLSGETGHHIARVLRMKPGETLTACDFYNKAYLCRIVSCAGDTVELEIADDALPVRGELPFPVTLYMALPKGDKMEWIIQKSVELGVCRIVPFSSRYTVVKLDEGSGEKKRERWQKIARASAEQCGRAIVPEVAAPVRYEEALRLCRESGDLSFVCYEGEEQMTLRKFLDGKTPDGLSFFIGAEGGFSEEEIEKARAGGIPCVSLGQRILRCETAPLYVMSAIGLLFEEL